MINVKDMEITFGKKIAFIAGGGAMNAFFFDQQLGGGCCRSHRAAMGGGYCCPEFEFLNDAHLGGGVDGRHFQRLTYREEEDLSVTS